MMITAAEIRAQCPQEMVDACEHGAIAALVSAGRTQIVQRLGGIGLVLEALGPVDGAALLDGLEAQAPSVPALRWALVLLNRGELDFGSASTRGMIDQLLPPLAADALKSVAVRPHHVSVADVIAALAQE